MHHNLEIQEICEIFINQFEVDANCTFFMDGTGKILIQVSYIHNNTLGLKSFDSFQSFKEFILKINGVNDATKFRNAEVV
jgi:hypothetical protein